jgi:hypothetical protein
MVPHLSIFQGLLMTPEPDDPLDNTIASEYLQDLAAYRIKASAHTAANAKQPLDEVLKGILGTNSSFINRPTTRSSIVR